MRIAIPISAVLLLSCGLVAQSPQPTAPSHNISVIITDSDNGKQIELPAKGTLVARLKGNPSTGYTWTIKESASNLRLVKSSTKRAPADGRVGTPATQEFRFTAFSAGMASLTLEYRRPWEHTSGPAKTFTVTVNTR